MSTEAPKRRWCRFSLRTLLVVMTLLCVAFAWIGWRLHRARENRAKATAIREVVEKIGKLGGDVGFSLTMPSVPGALDDFGPDSLMAKGNQTWLERQFDDPGDPDERDNIWHPTSVDFTGTLVSDADLEQLNLLVHLGYLDLDSTSITDAGLEHLEGMTGLAELNVYGTLVTDEGVNRLQQALPNCKIFRYSSEYSFYESWDGKKVSKPTRKPPVTTNDQSG